MNSKLLLTEDMTSNGTVEQIFALIQQGNASEDAGDVWEASDAFCQAQESLQKLSDSAASAEEKDGAEKQAEGDNKIALLYRQQSLEYLARAQKCFVKALENEAQKKKSGQTESLSDEEALSRIDLFAHLFSKPDVIKQQTEMANVQEQQSSLEDRFMQLNQSLPQGFKTSAERERDINRGLGRLGLSLYSNSDVGISSKLAASLDKNKSEGEQVDDIIAQAKDEVALAGDGGATSTDTAIDGSASGDAVSFFESILADSEIGDENDGSDIDQVDKVEGEGLTLEDADELRDKIADAQTSLSELVALLNGNTNDDDSVVLLDRVSAKRLLKEAGVALVKAAQHLAASS